MDTPAPVRPTTPIFSPAYTHIDELRRRKHSDKNAYIDMERDISQHWISIDSISQFQFTEIHGSLQQTYKQTT